MTNEITELTNKIGAHQTGEPLSDTAIMTYTGCIFDLFDKSTWIFRIEDIARALSNISRYAGHTVRPLSVAEHSVNVYIWLAHNGYSNEIQLLGLLHDAAEAYIGDIPRPWKKHVWLGKRPITHVEQDIEKMLFAREGLSQYYLEDWSTIKKADHEIYLQERAARPDPANQIVPQNYWNDIFLTTYHMLKTKIELENN